MVRTSAPGSSSGAFVDYNAGTSTPGTEVVAADQNNHQEEICNAIEGAGLTLASADQTQLKQAIIALSHGVGELVFSLIKKTTSALWPAVRIDDTSDTTITTSLPQLVTALRAEIAYALSVSSFSCSVTAGGVVTCTANAAAWALLCSALKEDAIAHNYKGANDTAGAAVYTNWRTLTIGGTDYAITGVDTSTPSITVSGTFTAGTFTVQHYPHRIAGSSVTARIYSAAGRYLAAQDSEHTNATHLPGIRRRDWVEKHYHQMSGGIFNASVSYTGNVCQGNGTYMGGLTATDPMTDGTNPIRATDRTEPRSFPAYLYLWGGYYAA